MARPEMSRDGPNRAERDGAPPESLSPNPAPEFSYIDEPDMAIEGAPGRAPPEPPRLADAPLGALDERLFGPADEPGFYELHAVSAPAEPTPDEPASSEPAEDAAIIPTLVLIDEPDMAIEGVEASSPSEAPAEAPAMAPAAAPLDWADLLGDEGATEMPVKIEAPARIEAVYDARPAEPEYWSEPAPVPVKEGGNVLEVRGLRKLYRKKVAVAEVAFAMSTGEVVGLLGPNGAGKTTVFYMIVGFIRPTAGRVSLDHHDITSMPMYQRARLGIAYLPQEPSVFRRLSVQDNIRAVLETRRDIDAKRKRALLDELLEEFGISGIRSQKAYTLSGGERRRTEIARSLALEPKFLLLDEPFAGIDPIAVHEIKSIVRRLSEAGIGVLITDHNVRDTLEITHRAHVINLGRIVVSGDREEVLASDTARRIYLGEQFRM